MGFKSYNYLKFAVIIVCVIWQLRNVVESAPSLEEKNPYCTECCDFYACMKLDRFNISTETSFVDHVCSNVDYATISECYSPKYISDCIFLQRTIETFPNNKIVEGFKATCEQRKYYAEMQNISKCIIASGFGGVTMDKCTSSFMNSLKDPQANLCEAIKTMNSCIIEIMTLTRCIDTNSAFYKEVIQNQNNPLCSNTSNTSSYMDLNIGVLIFTLLFITFDINLFRCFCS